MKQALDDKVVKRHPTIGRHALRQMKKVIGEVNGRFHGSQNSHRTAQYSNCRSGVFVSNLEFSASCFLPYAMFVNTTCTSSSSSTLSRITSTSAICSSVSSIGVVGMRSSPAFLVAMPRASMPWVSEAKSE